MLRALHIVAAAAALLLAGACGHCVAAGGVELDETEPQNCAVFVDQVDLALDELGRVQLPGWERENLELALEGWRVKVDPNPDHQRQGYWESQVRDGGACQWFHTFGQTWCDGQRLIVVADPDWNDGVLPHELAHAVMSCQGFGDHEGWEESGINAAVRNAARRGRERLNAEGGSL